MSDSSEISSKLEAGLRMETRELQMAMYILGEEVVEMLENGSFTVKEELPPVYNADRYGRRFSSNDPNFDSDTIITKKDEKPFRINEAYNIFTQFTLQENVAGKDLVVYYNIFNSAYFPFNSGKNEKNNIQKQEEVERNNEFLGKDKSVSAFDIKIRNEATREALSIYFDSYQYIFRKVVGEDGGEHIELEIIQFDGEGDRKILRRSNALEKVSAAHFDSLRNTAFKCLKRSK